MTMSDHEAFEAIQSHHRQLGAGVAQRVDALVDGIAAARGYEFARAELVNYLVDEILPHAAAEELTIYPEAAKRADLAATVVTMVAEHRKLAGLVESIASASNAEDAARFARALAELFAAHVATENEVLLPTLVGDEAVGVAGLLTQMQRLTEPRPETAPDAPASSADHESVVVTQLLKAALALARAGQGDEACAIVAGTWATLHAARPDLAEVVNRSLHRLVRLVSQEPVAIGTKRESSTELARAGQAERACTILAGTWATLRSPRRELAEVVNRSLHRLVRLATQEPVTFTVKPAVVTDPAEAVLDVRPMAPAQRHHTIFATYESLGAGESFTLVNDHDPKPLQYQFEAEHAGAFTWDYLERGPKVWRVRIGRVAA